MRHFPVWLMAILLGAFASIGMAHAANYPPRPDGPVLDQANIIPDDREAALDAKLRDYNQRTGRSLIVATVPSLQDEDIVFFAVKLFEAWGIGGKESDMGMLLLVAPNERKLRIENGIGLEEYLPDILAGRIIREVITPRFKAGDMPGGIEAGIDAVITQLDRSPADAKAVAEAAALAEQQKSSEGDGSSVVFWLVLMLVLWVLFARGGRRSYRRSGIDPGIVLWGVSEVARHMSDRGGGGGFDFGGGDSGGGFGGFGGGMSGGGGASGDW